jgi:hypothetical protein
MEIIRTACVLLYQAVNPMRDMGRSEGKLAMCLALYLATSRPLPVIAWDRANPAFHVINLPESAVGVRKHFHYEHIYYAGSQQGCSCAFNYEHEYDSILELRDYLRKALEEVEEIEAFACRIGTEEQDVQHALITSPEGIVLPEFFFKDGQFIVIRSGKFAEPVAARPKSFPSAEIASI